MVGKKIVTCLSLFFLITGFLSLTPRVSAQSCSHEGGMCDSGTPVECCTGEGLVCVVPTPVCVGCGHCVVAPKNIISGVVFVDNNQDGIFNSGDTGYKSGTTITLSGNAFSRTTTVVGDVPLAGTYRFFDISSGTYYVSVDVPIGYRQTTPTTVQVTMDASNPNAWVPFGIVDRSMPFPTRPPPTPISTPTPVGIQMVLLIDPKTVDKGNPVNLSITGIPVIDTVYRLQIRPFNASNCIGFFADIKIETFANGTCKVNARGDMWGNPICQKPSGKNEFIFSTIIDTSAGKLLDVSGEPSADYQLVLGTPSIEYSEPTCGVLADIFTVNLGPPAPFTITKILNEDLSENKADNPALEGSTVTIKLSGTKSGTYGYGLEGGQVFTKDCSGTTCDLPLKIPSVAASNVVIIVRDPDDKPATATLYVKHPVSTGVVLTLTPTPSPVPTHALPRPPHCAAKADGTPDVDANGFCLSVDSAIGNIPTKIGDFVNRLLGILIGIGAGIAVLLIIYAGYKLMTSQGNPEAIQNAKDMITSAIVGLLFIIFSIVILEVIGVDILKIPFWSL